MHILPAKLAAATAVLLVALAASHPVLAAWPEQTVRFIVGQGPGSAQDIGARTFGEQLAKRWGQPVVIENRPGADGIIAITAFTSARDNHTLLFAASGSFTAHPVLRAKVPYDPADLVPVAKVSTTVIGVGVPTAINVNTLADLVARARAQPGGLNMAPTPGTTELAFNNFLAAAGVTMAKVPYADITKALTDLGENRIQVMVSAVAVMKPLVESGKVKVLAITNPRRAAIAPELPTATEAGFAALSLDGLIGLFGPRSLPEEVKARIAADVREVAADPGIAARFAATGQVLDPAGPAPFAAAVDAQRRAMIEIGRTLGMKPSN